MPSLLGEGIFARVDSLCRDGLCSREQQQQQQQEGGPEEKRRKKTDARTHGARRSLEVNASRSPKFLGQPVVRATRSTELVDPPSWVAAVAVVVVVAPVTSIPTEALQSKRPMPKTRITRELSLSRTSSSRYPTQHRYSTQSIGFRFFPQHPSAICDSMIRHCSPSLQSRFSDRPA